MSWDLSEDQSDLGTEITELHNKYRREEDKNLLDLVRGLRFQFITKKSFGSPSYQMALSKLNLIEKFLTDLGLKYGTSCTKLGQ